MRAGRHPLQAAFAPRRPRAARSSPAALTLHLPVPAAPRSFENSLGHKDTTKQLLQFAFGIVVAYVIFTFLYAQVFRIKAWVFGAPDGGNLYDFRLIFH